MNLTTSTILMAFLVVPSLMTSSPAIAHNPEIGKSTETAIACHVDISSSASIQRYLEGGLRTSDAGGSRLTYKTLYDWNTVGIEIRFDNGNRVSGINVRISPGHSRATISMDFPEINSSGVYYLTADGVLKSSDGTFSYRCQ